MLNDCLPLRALLLTVVGWVSREQQRTIEYLVEENRVLKEQIGVGDLGHRVGRTTVSRILKREGIKPAPERPSSWSAFIKATWGKCAAADFFSGGGLKVQGPHDLPHAVRHGHRDAAGTHRRDDEDAERGVHGSDRTQSHRCRRWRTVPSVRPRPGDTVKAGRMSGC